MTSKTRKFSIAIIAFIAAVCMFVAILGFVGVPKKANAQAQLFTASDVQTQRVYSGAGDATKSIFTKEAPADGATKVYLKYTPENLYNTGSNWFSIESYNGTSYASAGGKTSVWLNSQFAIMRDFCLEIDLNTKAAKLYSQELNGTSTRLDFAFTADLTEYNRFGLKMTGVSDVAFTWKDVCAYDDTGKDLGIQFIEGTWNKHDYTATLNCDTSAFTSVLPNTLTTYNIGVEAGTKLVVPTFTKSGYVFLGWYTDSAFNNAYDFNNVVNADVTLYAKWQEVIQHNITFNTNGGNNIEATVVDNNCILAEPDAPVKDGYAFAGWYTDETLQNRYDFSAEVTQNLTLHAKWAAVSEQLLYASGVNELSIQSNIKPDDNATTLTIEYTPIAVSGQPTGTMWQLVGDSIYNGVNTSNGDGFIQRLSKVGYTYRYIINLVDKSVKLIESQNDTFRTEHTSTMTADLSTAEHIGIWLNGNTSATLLWKAKVYDNTGKDLGIRSSNGWVFADHTVTFNSNDGNPVNPIGVANNGTITAPIAVKEGKIFAGWYADSALTNKYDFTAPITNNITLYAKYYDQTPLYTAKVNNTSDANTTVLSRLAPSDNATKVYFEYTLSDEQIKDVCGWLGARMYQTLGAGASYKELAGIQFGVYNNPCLAANTTYIITFDLVNNTMTWVDKAVPSVVLKEGTLAEGAIKDFAYFGFYVNITQDTLFTSDSIVSVRAYDDLGKDLRITTTTVSTTEIELPEVTFVTNGGSSIDKQTVYGATATIPTDCVKANYEIEAWCLDEQLQNAYDFDDEVTVNITLYAKWTEATFYITYDSMKGSAVEKTSAKYNTPAPAPQQNPTKTNYVFDGWYVDDSYTAKYDFNTPLTENITLYAKWAPVKFTITFVTNGGSAIDPLLADYGTGAIKPNDPTKEGYELEGWYLDEALTRKYNFGTTVSSDLTLYAKWVKADETPTTTPDTTPETDDDGGCGAAVNSTFALGAVLIFASAIMIVRKINKKEN